MKKEWNHIALGDVLTRADRFEERDEWTEYPFAGTYSFARGIFVGERKMGSSFKLPKIQRIKEGDFVYCKIMAWEGAFGLVPHSANDCVMSGAFVAYEIDTARLDPRFLDLYFKIPSNWKGLGGQSSGTNIRRQSLHPRQFEAHEIPLPPLAEQRRIVARIEDLLGQVEVAKSLRNQSIVEANALTSANLGKRFDVLSTAYPIVPLEGLTTHILDGPHVTPNYLPEATPGVPFVTVKNMVSGRLDFTGLRYVSEEDHLTFTRRCKPERGDVLYSKDGATRGRPCLVDTDREFSYFVSVALIKPIREQLDGRFLCHLLNSNWIKDRMATKSRGDMIPHIVLREIRAFPVPLPSLSEQHEIVAELDALQAEVDALRRLQAETSAELDALLPAILDRAFKGEP